MEKNWYAFRNALEVSRLGVLGYLHGTVEDVLHRNVRNAVVVVHRDAKHEQQPPAATSGNVAAPSSRRQRVSTR